MLAFLKMLRLHALIVALCAAVFVSSTHAETPSEKEKTPLAKEMAEMGKSLRTLKRQVANPSQNPSSIKIVNAMEKNAAAAKTLAPAKAKEIPETEREKWIADYRAKISDLESALTKIENSLRENHNDEAKILVEKLGTLRREGHEKFNAEDEDKK